MAKNSYTAIVEKEGAFHVALSPELDVASQGTTIEGQHPISKKRSNCSLKLRTRRK